MSQWQAMSLFVDGFRVPAPGDVHLVILVGTCLVFAVPSFFLQGVAFSNGVLAAAFQPLVPVAVYVLSLLMGAETCSARKLLGLLVAVFGGVRACVSNNHHLIDDNRSSQPASQPASQPVMGSHTPNNTHMHPPLSNCVPQVCELSCMHACHLRRWWLLRVCWCVCVCVC